ncbi:hypothetical protein KHQ06_15940 [Nocardia tengchongensis]|uniref:Uncharacterized protein n=1 Tax=Nocardia tengchongensis TaxID=2055889 RepID=A0ABX8D138_9NOCA|nr:hypothetical protein [Nocardia tengchongensis]QVI24130.1 hypothetical protein KHQ06_15940 [Nocardia tengchongensis]
MSTNKGIDWDGELQALMESSGIKHAELTRPTWATRARRKALGARPFLAAIAITGPLMWVITVSGAPAAAVVPLVSWLVGWIGYGAWISLGRPDATIAAHAIAAHGGSAFAAASRFCFTQSRPARARWRAWRAAARRRTAAPGEATA